MIKGYIQESKEEIQFLKVVKGFFYSVITAIIIPIINLIIIFVDTRNNDNIVFMGVFIIFELIFLFLLCCVNYRIKVLKKNLK